jgi:alpha-beta hydrolase superfamily lysophospholipase
MPAAWNGDLVIFAHGFVAPQEPVGIPEGQLTFEDGTSLPQIVNLLGYAFAMSSYRKNGLAILEGVEDTRELVQIFTAQHGAPRRVYLTGASEGGLVTALAAERYPATFNGGGLAACGPVGDFPAQINYLGDARILFDYFFPGVIPGDPLQVPQNVIQTWDSHYEPLIKSMLLASPGKTQQIMRTGQVPTQFQGAEADAEAVITLLWYNVKATNDAVQELHGRMYDNRGKVYFGSDDDAKLNRDVRRFSADAAAVQEMRRYQTSGRLSVPLVTLHTTSDPEVPYFHEPLYKLKAPGLPHVDIPVLKPGHCNFSAWDALSSFLVLTWLR